MIPHDTNNPQQPPHTSIITNYGQIDLDHIKDYETTFINTPTRPAQDTAMLYHCLMNSLSAEALTILTIWKDDYIINKMPPGNLLFKVIIRERHINTNATESSIRTKLSSLDVYMAQIDHDIPKFNPYAKHQLQALATRGATTNDILRNLFKGYLACMDQIFHIYIEKKQEVYEEGTNIAANELILWAKNKYDNIKHENLWNALSLEQK